MRLSTNHTGKSRSTCPLSLLVLGLAVSAPVTQAAPVSWNETALAPVADGLGGVAPAASRVLGGLMPAQTQVGGVAVPLFQGRKQGVGITNDDGTANVDALQRQTLLIKAKYQSTIAAYLANTGQVLGEMITDTSDSANSTASDTMFPSEMSTDKSDMANNTASSGRGKMRTRRQSEGLKDYNNDLLWAGTVSFGTPTQSFTILFDTGSSDTWIPSSDEQCTGCRGSDRYDPDLSTSAEAQDGMAFALTYGDGSSTSGPVYTETIQMAGYYADQQYFSPVNQLSDSFASDPEDGIMGMAYESISAIGAGVQNAFSSVPYGIRLAKPTNGASELFIGGANPARYKGPIEYHPVLKQAYFNISGTPLLNGQPVFGRRDSTTIIDSGTTTIVAPPRDAAAFWAKVPGSSAMKNTNGYYSYPCASTPSLSFTFMPNGRAWSVSAADMNLGRVSSTSKSCVGAVVGLDVGLGGSTWILGDTFMKNVYTVFDTGNNRVGFATPV